jgi:hypothetical protein
MQLWDSGFAARCGKGLAFPVEASNLSAQPQMRG